MSYLDLFTSLEDMAGDLSEGSVVAVSSAIPAYLVGRDRQGCAYVLIEPLDHQFSPHVNYRLAEVEARLLFSARVEMPSGSYSSDFALIKCFSNDLLTQRYFFGVCEAMAGILGSSPTSAAVGDSLARVMRIFSRIESKSKTSMTGLLGELIFMLRHPSPVAAIHYWHATPSEKYDFVFPGLRLDVKATSSYERRHHLSLEQIELRGDIPVYFASVLIDFNSSGASGHDILDKLVELCEADLTAAIKVQEVVANLLGERLREFFELRFDLASAISSVSIYDGLSIPRLELEPPPGVSAVEFVSDFSIAPKVPLQNLFRGSVPDGPTLHLA